MVNPARNTRRNLETNEGQTTSQRPQGDDGTENQLASGSTTKFHPTPQGDASQGDDAAQSSQSDEDVDYEKLLAEEEVKRRRLHAKRELRIAQARNKLLSEPLREDEVRTTSPRRSREGHSDDETSEPALKRQRSARSIRPAQLDHYYGKNFKEWKDWTRSARNSFEASEDWFPTEISKIRWAQQYLRDTPAARWEGHKDKRTDEIKRWNWEQFAQYLVDLIEDPENRRLASSRRYEEAKQSQSQSVNDFVAYIETLEADLDEYTERQRRDHLLHRLRRDLREKVNSVAQIPETRGALVALAQRMEGALPARADVGNKTSERGSFSGSRNNSRGSSYSRKPERATSTTETRDGSATGSRRGSTTKLSLRGSDKASSGAREKRTCYNCGEEGHIQRECPKPAKDNPQVNAVDSSRKSSGAGGYKAPPPRPLIEEVSDDSEN